MSRTIYFNPFMVWDGCRHNLQNDPDSVPALDCLLRHLSSWPHRWKVSCGSECWHTFPADPIWDRELSQSTFTWYMEIQWR
jgi:hypothetical protein